MEDTILLNKNIAALLKVFEKINHDTPDKETPHSLAEPRQVINNKKNEVIVVDLGDKVKKFFKGIFDFDHTEPQKKLKNTSSFWTDTLALIGAGLVALYEYFKKRIQPLISGLWDILEKVFTLISKKAIQLYEYLSDTEIGKIINEWWKSFAAIFKEGALGKLLLKNPVIETIGQWWDEFRLIFSKEGALGKLISGLIEIFSKNGIVTLFFEKVAIFAKILGPIFEIVGIVLLPLMAAINGFQAYKNILKEGGDTFSAKFQGWMAFITSILTLGFINFEDIKQSLASLMDDVNTGNIIKTIEDSVIFILEAIGKIPVKAVQLIVSLFDKEAGDGFQAWISEFNLIKIMTPFFNVFNDALSFLWADISESFTAAWNFFTKDIPKYFENVFADVKSIFQKGFSVDKVIAILKDANPINLLSAAIQRFASFMQELFSKETVDKGLQHIKEFLPTWLGGTEAPHEKENNALPLPPKKEHKVASLTASQVQTTSVAHTNQPLEHLASTSLDVSKKSAEKSAQQNDIQIKLIAKNNELLTTLIQILSNQPKTGPVVLTNNSSVTQFRSQPSGIQGFRTDVTA